MVLTFLVARAIPLIRLQELPVAMFRVFRAESCSAARFCGWHADEEC
jgi:hypothetical protein